MAFLYLFFAVGIIVTGYLPQLPSVTFIVCCLVPAFFFHFSFSKKFSFSYWLLAFLLGATYSTYAGYQFLDNQLPDELAGQEIVVEGQISGLQQEDNRRQLFTMDVTQAYALGNNGNAYSPFPDKITISSYDNLRVKTGEQWRLVVKLKVPRGFVNPGGFDYQASLLRRGLGATGYVRSHTINKLLQAQPNFSMEVLRYKLQQWLIRTSHSHEKGILVALLVGDTSLVDKAQWGEMIKTGTNHLIAISGLHLGFFAIVGFFIGNFAGRFLQLVWHRCPSLHIGYIFAVVFTVFYSIIAGLNIPTFRTLIMLAVVQAVYLWRRSFKGQDTLLLALVVVLIYDPLASFDIGFWLSFGAVAMLIFCFSGRIKLSESSSITISLRQYISDFLKSQWIMFIGLLIPLAILVHTSSLLAPPANFLAIPVITFFVVPCLILSAICHLCSFGLESFFLHCAESGLTFVHYWLNYLLVAGEGRFNPVVNINACAVMLAVLSVFLILLPRGLANKYLGLFGLVLALIIPLQRLPALQFLIFDVGQGTAILIRTPHHQLIYDTGPLYTENFDAGSGILAPYLMGQGVRHLDTIIVSHNDQDHSGGLAGLLSAITTDHLWLGEPDKYHPENKIVQAENCHNILPWQWDEINFRFINWPISPTAKANNHSCVLLVEFNNQRILLTGDIEKEVERELLASNSLQAIDILLAPHHGSHTSSTTEFVTKTHPHYVIYSAGYHNQHGHPHKDVQERYRLIDAIPLNTAYSGALEFIWEQQDKFHVNQYRQINRRYWFAQPENQDSQIHKN